MNLLSILRGEAPDAPLDEAALEMAQIEYGPLDQAPFLEQIQTITSEVQRRTAHAAPEEFIGEMNRYLFNELGFRGNQEDYYNPANSFLNSVLTRRQGIPISLAVLYISIARRLERPVYGVGIPGHFVTVYRGPEFQTWIDAFHQGKLLTAEDCAQLAQQTSGFDLSEDLTLLEPVDNQYILLRMLNNLRNIYLGRRAHRKCIAVIDLMLEASPESVEEYRIRAALLMEEGRFAAARDDLERYVALAGEGPEQEQLERQLAALRHWVARLN